MMKAGNGQDRDIRRQRDYYKRSAAQYDSEQVHAGDEHAIALSWMAAMIEQQGLKTVLDIGSGTGRALLYLKDRGDLELLGIEPSADLREIGYQKGLTESQLVDGDALSLDFADNSFDLVCSFGVLHHIKDHRQAVAEMTRVARKAVFISDANNFGQGSALSRLAKQGIKAIGLWKLFDLVRTKGKGYHYSEGDGVFYSYSIFDDVPIVKSKFPDIMYMSTRPSGNNLYRTAQTIAMFATKAKA